ncbi:MAG: hypothetical protein JWN40_3814 [Phycisphaerales bacterium]|nr:hypothetical protein [Phycisphaerales bacterium]
MKVPFDVAEFIEFPQPVICLASAAAFRNGPPMPYEVQEAAIRARMSLLGFPHENAVVLRDDWERLRAMALNGEIYTLAVPSLDLISSPTFDGRFVAQRVRERGGRIVSFSEYDSRFMADQPFALALATMFVPFWLLPTSLKTFTENLESDIYRGRALIEEFQVKYERAVADYEVALRSPTSGLIDASPAAARQGGRGGQSRAGRIVIVVRESGTTGVSCEVQEAVLRARLLLLGRDPADALVLRDDSDRLRPMADEGEVGTLAVASVMNLGQREGDADSVAFTVLDGGEVISLDPVDGGFMLERPLAIAAHYNPLASPYASVADNLARDRRMFEQMISRFRNVVESRASLLLGEGAVATHA